MPGKNGGGGLDEISSVEKHDDGISLLELLLQDVAIVEILFEVVGEIGGEDVEIKTVFAVDLGQIRRKSGEEKTVVDLSARIAVTGSIQFC